jgi:hypothetical protein
MPSTRMAHPPSSDEHLFDQNANRRSVVPGADAPSALSPQASSFSMTSSDTS